MKIWKRNIGLMAISLIAVALVSCLRPAVKTVYVPSSQLVAIDSLMQTRPDSALVRLIETPVDDPYYQLLFSEALYKNDNPPLNRKELLDAMAYFDSIGCPFLSARCHYMSGVGYYEMDSVVPACKEYLMALEIMEDHFDEKDLVGYKAKFMALTYTHLCGLFSDQYLPEQTIYFGKQSLLYYDKYDAEPWHIAWQLVSLGTQYDMTDQLDSAICYYQEARSYINDTTSLLYRDIEALLSYLFYRTGTDDYLMSLYRLYHLLSLTESEKEYISRCFLIGEIYFQEKHMDSAEYYLRKVYGASNSIDSRTLSAQHLQEISTCTGDTTSFNKYTEFLSEQAAPKGNQALLHSKLTKLYHDFEQNKNEKNLLKQQHELMSRAKRVILILLMIAAVVLALLLLNRKRMRKQKIESEKQLEEERHIHIMQQSAISGRLRESNRMLRELKTKDQNQSNSKIEKCDTHATTFVDEPICRYILQLVNEGNFKSQMDFSVYKQYALGKEHLLALRQAADHHFGQFTNRLAKTYPSLSKSDIDYCCLYLLGLSDADISALMQRAYNTINERNNKLRKMLGVEKQLSSTLNKIANDNQSSD